MKFISSGVIPLCLFLSEITESGGPLHDLDLYRQEKETQKIGRNFIKAGASAKWKMLSEKTSRSVDKYELQCTATLYRLDIDQVNLFKAPISPSADIWGNLCATYIGGQFRLEKLVNRLEVPLEVTISNVLAIGREPDVAAACYVLRQAAMPKYDDAGKFIENDSYCDGRFRRKLHNRRAQGLVSLEQMWEPGPVIPDGTTFLPPSSLVCESDGDDEDSGDDNMDDVEDGPLPARNNDPEEEKTFEDLWPQEDWEREEGDGSWKRCESDSDGSFFEVSDGHNDAE